MNGAELIAQERQRQVEQEGYSAEQDDQHKKEQLVFAAMAYCWAGKSDRPGNYTTIAYSAWPWDREAWKPKDRLSNLVRAGALIAAEIDRFLREGANAG